MSAKIDMENLILNAITDRVRSEACRIVENKIEEARVELRDKIAQITSEVTLKVMKHVSFERYGNDLHITVLMKEIKER